MNNEDNATHPDPFTTNTISSVINGTDDVAIYETPADVNTSGGSLFGKPLLGSSSTDVSLHDYLARPRLLYSGSVDGFVPTLTPLSYAYDFLHSADVLEKLKYHNLVRGTFQVKLIITCAPFATGMLGMSSMYGVPYLYGASPANVPFLVHNMLQKTHSLCDLGSTNSCMLSIPFHLRVPYVLNSDPDIAELQRLIAYFYTVTPIENTQINTNTLIYYKIYVSLVDAEVSIPVPVAATYTSHSHKRSETHEAMTGPISYPASIISMIGKQLRDVPYIGRMARAFEIGAGAVANIAKLFGFSRPRDLSKPCYPHLPMGASGVGEVRSKNLTLDPMQEVTVDPSVFGEIGDNLSFTNTIMRYGFFNITTWSLTDTAGTTIQRFPVSPSICEAHLDTFEYINPTPLSFASNLFQSWRGSLTYKFMIPANRFVRGKLRIYWTPDYQDQDLAHISNKALSVLIDLSMTTTAEITVPWLSDNLIKSIQPHQFVGSTTYDAINTNGYLHIIVEEALLVSNTNWDAYILCFVKASDDFQFFIPHTKTIQDTCFSIPSSSPSPLPYTSTTLTPPTAGTFAPPFQGTAWATYTASSNDVNPTFETTVQLFPSSNDNRPALLHTGEHICSLRSILKRFDLYWVTSILSVPNATITGVFLPYLPRPYEFTSGGDMYPTVATPIAYLSRMFAGMRGSVRICVIPSDSNDTISDLFVSRGFGKPFSYYSLVSNATNAIFDWKWLNKWFNYGVTYFRRSTEPIIFDIPFQNYHWFYPTVTQADADRAGESTYGAFLMSMNDPWIRNTRYYYSAGEDFQFVIYNGPPIYSRYVQSYPAT